MEVCEAVINLLLHELSTNIKRGGYRFTLGRWVNRKFSKTKVEPNPKD